MLPWKQIAALPFREGPHGLEILRETKRWILPKGWPEKGTPAAAMAAREAFAEAGITGRMEPDPCGSSPAIKQLGRRKAMYCTVVIYRLQVEQELDRWPKMAECDRRWFTPGQAVMVTGERGLVPLLLSAGLLTA